MKGCKCYGLLYLLMKKDTDVIGKLETDEYLVDKCMYLASERYVIH